MIAMILHQIRSSSRAWFMLDRQCRSSSATEAPSSKSGLERDGHAVHLVITSTIRIGLDFMPAFRTLEFPFSLRSFTMATTCPVASTVPCASLITRASSGLSH